MGLEQGLNMVIIYSFTWMSRARTHIDICGVSNWIWTICHWAGTWDKVWLTYISWPNLTIKFLFTKNNWPFGLGQAWAIICTLSLSMMEYCEKLLWSNIFDSNGHRSSTRQAATCCNILRRINFYVFSWMTNRAGT